MGRSAALGALLALALWPTNSAANSAALGPVDPDQRVLGPMPRGLPGGAPTKPRPALVHPVRGAANYGGAGAQFGDSRGSRSHGGQDVFAPAGTPVVAIADAIVLSAGGGDARGNYAELFDRTRSRTYLYFHMAGPAKVKPGRRVAAGQVVGAVGCTGSCWGDHLHLEVRLGRGPQGRAIDPRPLLERIPRA